jgi:FMN phosphatase YigB (HAD superfamily)
MGSIFGISMLTFGYASVAYIKQKRILKKSTNKFLRSGSINPQNSIISFDIHGVIFNHDYKKILNLLLQTKGIYKIFFYLLNPIFTYDIFKLLKKRAVPEEYIQTLNKKHPYIAPYTHLTIAITNAQKPNLQVIQLIEQLKQCDYTLHIFSNIGPSLYENLAKEFPNIFKQFDTIHIPQEQNSFVTKPHPQAFKNYLQTCNIQQKQIIFIDNNRRNIDMALKHNMFGIHFKNCQKLSHLFVQLGIMHKFVAKYQ